MRPTFLELLAFSGVQPAGGEGDPLTAPFLAAFGSNGAGGKGAVIGNMFHQCQALLQTLDPDELVPDVVGAGETFGVPGREFAEVSWTEFGSEELEEKFPMAPDDGFDLSEVGGGRRGMTGKKSLQFPEKPRASQAASTDDHSRAAGLPHPKQGVAGVEEVSIAEDGDAQGGAQFGDGIPVGFAVIELGGGASMEGDGVHALLLGNATGFPPGEMILVDPEADLDAEVLLGRTPPKSGEEALESALLVREGGASSRGGQLADRTAQVEVQVLDPLVGQDPGSLLQDLGLLGEELQGLGVLVGEKGSEVEGLFVVLQNPTSGNHLAHVEGLTKGPAKGPVRSVGHSGHGGENHGHLQLQPSDAQGREFSLPGRGSLRGRVLGTLARRIQGKAG